MHTHTDTKPMRPLILLNEKQSNTKRQIEQTCLIRRPKRSPRGLGVVVTVIPAPWETKVGRSFEVRSLRPA